ncbi:hypothetical protein FACS1894166_08400 [Bacilli bacterium]|nr:hypothetical protein FACS1894166_08400 [Bacilli bacterium]
MPVKKIKKSVKPKINKPAKPVISTKVVTKFGVKHGQIGKYQELANELDIIKTETGDAVKEINKAVDIFLNFAAGNDEKEALTSELIDKVPT